MASGHNPKFAPAMWCLVCFKMLFNRYWFCGLGWNLRDVVLVEKTVEVNLWLFGKPEWESGDKIDPELLRRKGDELKERLYEIADNLQKLSANGWDYDMRLYDIGAYKSTSKSRAVVELKKLGIDEEVFEWEDE